jgi:hypothetical protein
VYHLIYVFAIDNHKQTDRVCNSLNLDVRDQSLSEIDEYLFCGRQFFIKNQKPSPCVEKEQNFCLSRLFKTLHYSNCYWCFMI